MNELEHIRCRVSTRAVITGVLLSLAVMGLLMSLAAALGVWTFSFEEFATPDSENIWTAALISWVISMFVGAYMSSMSGRSITSGDGILHGLTTWAASTVVSYIFIVLAFGSFLLLSFAPWSAFLSGAVALAMSILGGVLGARSEVKVERKREIAATRPALGNI